MTYTITIPQWHPATNNQLLEGRWQAAKYKRSDRSVVAYYSKKSKCPKAEGKRLVGLFIMLKKGQRGADVDAYHKSLLDALVKAEMLVDDNSNWAELSPVEFERGTESVWGTRITLTDIHGKVIRLPRRFATGSTSDHIVKPRKKGTPPV